MGLIPFEVLVFSVVAEILVIIFLEFGFFDRWLFAKAPTRVHPPHMSQWWLRCPSGTFPLEYIDETENGVSFAKIRGQNARIPGIKLWVNMFPDSLQAFSGKGYFISNICLDGFQRPFLDNELNQMFDFLKRQQSLKKIEKRRMNAEEEDEVDTLASQALKESKRLDAKYAEKDLHPPQVILQQKKLKRRAESESSAEQKEGTAESTS